MIFFDLLQQYLYARRTNTWDEQQLANYQGQRFRKILKHAYNNFPFYNKFYKKSGIKEEHLDKIELRNIPTIDKTILMNHFDELVCDRNLKRKDIETFLYQSQNVRNKYRGGYTIVRTSGTSGQIGIFIYSQRDWALLKAIIRLKISKSNLNPFKKINALFIGAIDSNYGSISMAYEVPRLFYNFMPLDIHMPLDLYYEKINNFQPDYINGYSSGVNLLALAQLKGQLNIKPKKIFCSSDALTETYIRNIKQAFGIYPINIYGACESLCLGQQQLPDKMYRLFYDYNIVEILDNNNNQVSLGESGKLILTNLYNYTQPLIRYKMNDELIAGETVPQPGFGFSTINSFSGRQEDTLYFNNNDNKPQALLPRELWNFYVPGLEKFQFFQQPHNALLMKAQVTGNKEQIKFNVNKEMKIIFQKNNLDKKVEFTVELVDTINNNPETGKFKLINPYTNE